MYKELNKLIKKYTKIIIHRHQRPDGDALGSQFGMSQLIKDNFEGKEVFVVGNKTEFENHSISNIFKEPFKNPTKKDYDGALVIVVDTANIDRIEGSDWVLGDEIVKIDHHVTSEEFGTLEIVEDTISSACEIVTKIAMSLKWNISKKASEYLLAGMITDTGRFMFNSVKAGTFDAAAELSRSGAKISSIVNKLNDRDLNFIRLQAFVQANFKHKDGVSYYLLPKGTHKKFGVDYDTSASMVFLLMGFREAKYAVYISYDENKGYWKGSLRSKELPINQIAEKYNGGGHNMASGFRLENKKDFDKIVKELKKLAKSK